MPPFWFITVAVIVLLIVLFMLPSQLSKPAVHLLIEADAAKLVGVLGAVIVFFVVLSTAYQIKVDLDDRADQRMIRRDEAIDRAWTRLLARAPGNTGKGGALSLLVREGESINGIDLSCRAIGDWDPSSGEDGKCRRVVIFSGISISRTNLYRDSIELVDMSDTHIRSARIEKVNIFRSIFDRSNIANLEGKDFYTSGSFYGTTISANALLDSFIESSGGNAPPRIIGSNVSGATLPWLEQAPESDLITLYFWADWPPQRAPNSNGSNQFPFFGTDLLNRMRICRPPRDIDGKPIVRARRKIRFPDYECDRMSAEAAIRTYPEAFVARSPSFGFKPAR